MLYFRSVRFAMAGLLLVPYCLAAAQQISVQDLLKGNYGKYATTLKVADLPDDYTPVKLVVPANATDPLSALMLAFSRPSQDRKKASLIHRLADSYWSNGDVVHALNKDFLVTYKLDPEGIVQISQAENMIDSAPPQTMDVDMRINLIALDSIQGVSPNPDITKKDLVDMFGSGSKVAPSPTGVSARQTATLSNVKQMALGLIMYTNDYDDALPYAQSTQAAQFVIYPYIKNKSVFKTLNPKGGSILLNMGISGALSTSIPEPANTVLLYESEPWEDGRRAVAFCDGHAKLVDSATWATLSKRLRPSGIKRVGKPLPANYGKDFNPDAAPNPRGGG